MYITKDDLIDRYGVAEITQLERNIGDDNAVQSAIDDACVEVEGYVARQYRLPLPVITKSLKRATAIVARYYLYKDRASGQVRQDYEDVIIWLDKIASGKVKLVFGLDDNQNSGQSTSGESSFVSGAFVV